MDLSEFQSYYANLLIVQYNGLPRASSTVKALAELFFFGGLPATLTDAFNMVEVVGSQTALLDQLDRLGALGVRDIQGKREAILASHRFPLAVGKQLDILGEYIGAGRYYIKDNQTLSLDDYQYRILLKLKSLQNHSNHSWQAVTEMCWDAFRSALIPDSSGPLEIIYWVNPTVISPTVLDAAFYWDAIPRPMTVGFGGTIDITEPYFSFTSYGTLTESVELFGINALGDVLIADPVTGARLIFDRPNSDYLAVNADGDRLMVDPESGAVLCADEFTPAIPDIRAEVQTGYATYSDFETKPGAFLHYGAFRK